MPLRSTLWTLGMLVAFIGLGRPTQAATLDDSPIAALDTAAAAGPSDILTARLAYQNAWAQRQAGEFEAAAATADSGLQGIAVALKGDIDLRRRVELNDLQSRLTGLRNAAQHDREAETTAAKNGNTADEHVLNAPAVEEIEPQVNSQVLKWIEFFTGNGRSTFERWLKRSGRYMDLFRRSLQKEGLPPDLVHLVFVESGFNLHARSVSAAVGPWQFLRSTGRLFGLAVNQWVDERRDPEKSTVAAARYLKHLYTMFGDWPLALASYNAGEGTVLRAIKAQGTTNYWDLRLPRQTEEYVPQFMAILAISRDPGRYGFDAVELDEPMAFDEVALKGAVDLRTVAQLADCSYDELKQLNPAVLHHAAPGANGVTMLRVPRGKGEALMGKLEHGAQLPAVDLTVRHLVRRGETITSIAGQYHVSAQRLALANNIGRKRPLRRGMTILVPASLGAPAPVVAVDNDDPRYSTAYVPPRTIATKRQVEGDSKAEGRRVHVVKRGETLAGIANQYGVSVSDLRSWNRIKTSHVRRGTRLKIRTSEAASNGSADATLASSTKSGTDGSDAKDSKDSKSSSNDGKESKSSKDAKVSKDDAKDVASNVKSHGRDEGATGADVKDAGKNEPVASATTSKASKPARPRVIVVQRGDTLVGIAERHKVSVSAIRRLNGMRTSQVYVGQRLKLPTG
jgi:membrane-bound lytic murein transglycosylase D